VLIRISPGYPPVQGRLHTCYAPVRRSQKPKFPTPRLACVMPAASVHPERGSNFSSYILTNFRQRYSRLIQLNSLKPFSCFVLSIRYVYELACLLFYRLSFKSGAIVQPLFLISKPYLKNFLIYFSVKIYFISFELLGLQR